MFDSLKINVIGQSATKLLSSNIWRKLNDYPCCGEYIYYIDGNGRII